MGTLSPKTYARDQLRKRFPRAVTFDGLHRKMKPEVRRLVESFNPLTIKGDPQAVENAAIESQKITPGLLSGLELVQRLKGMGIEVYCGKIGGEVREVYFASTTEKKPDGPLFNIHKEQTKAGNSEDPLGKGPKWDVYYHLSLLSGHLVRIWINEKPAIPLEVKQGVEDQLEIKAPKTVDVLSEVLVKRGIRDQSSLWEFYNPTIESPSELPDIEPAADGLSSFIKQRKKIAIYGDYDVDGIIGTAVLFNALRRLGANANYFIPNRFSDGYGLNIEALRRLKEQGAEALITVDCGSNQLAEIKTLISWGVSPFITDHHPSSSLTELESLKRELGFFPMVNPRLLPKSHPSSNLCGASVAFKLAQQLYRHLGENPAAFERANFGLLALATVADVVPLLGENRAIVKKGLEALRKASPFAVKALRKAGDLDEVSTATISFGIAPMINAIGRLEDGGLAAELFTTATRNRAYILAHALRNANERRKLIELNILESALLKIDQEYGDLARANSLVLWDNEWHEGVVGIVASRLVEAFGHPAILLSINAAQAKGSGRSSPDLDLYQALRQSEEHLARWGGHKAAAGLSLKASTPAKLRHALLRFRRKFSQSVGELLEGEELIPKVFVDSELGLSDIRLPLLEGLSQLEPFGAGNPLPCFLIRNLRAQNLWFSAKGSHLYSRLSDGEIHREAVGWRKKYLSGTLRKAKKVNVVCNLTLASWHTGCSQIEIIDAKESEE